MAPKLSSGAAAALAALEQRANPRDSVFLQRFFKTGPGQYGAGDVFLGIRVPALREIARAHATLPLRDCVQLLRSPLHEARALALMVLVRTHAKGNREQRQAIHDAYLANMRFVNNWDLVDASAAQLVGQHLEARSRGLLTRLARSSSLWERRIAIVATHHFIRQHDLADTFRIAEILLDDDEDLIHKAVGWMLREAGKRDAKALEAFLRDHYQAMPRTMLRYAIEKFPETRRKQYLRGEV